MDMTKFCKHTYLRWKDKTPVCAVCSMEMDGEYDRRFTGTFPRAEYEKGQLVLVMPSTVTLTTLNETGWVPE